jgi:protocatechuate 3,4-dioxygenase beta subunit
MTDKHENTRRKFLKNASLATLSLGAMPMLAANLPGAKAEPSFSCDKTTLDYYGQGPFYKASAPNIQNNQLAAANEPGTRLIISGRVHNLDCTEFLPNTKLDVWHANDAGQYDNSGYTLRGVATTNNQGFYLIETVKPGKYLNGGQYRPSHIHFKITPPGFGTLTTQLYFEGDPSIPTDAAASITNGTYDASARIIPLTLNGNGEYEGTWDIVVDGDGQTIGLPELHLDKGMIYSLSPNPFSERLEIRYGVFKPARISIFVYDLSGRQVAELETQDLSPDKYSAFWQPPASLPDGHYFVALKINDFQVHYQKVIYKR